MSKKKKYSLIILLIAASCLVACRHDEIVIPPDYEEVDDAFPDYGNMQGFYLLNEGNMGSNKCTLDYFDFTTSVYSRNIYAERNPHVIKELGDVGNDMQIYGNKLYIVVNCSHKVEVLNSATGERVGQIDIPNCRYIKFHKGKGYVSSFVGPVEVDENCPRGEVYEVDTLSLTVKRKVTVGYQPEEMEIKGDYLYLANSGGYRPPEYDNTVSVVRLSDFQPQYIIPVGINLFRIRRDKYNRLWVSSRGNRKDVAARLYLMAYDEYRGRMEVIDSVEQACSNMVIHGDSIYCIASSWDDITMSNAVNYAIVDIRTREIVNENFITDGTDKLIKRPYGLAVNPINGDIYISDAKNYVSSGTLYCFDKNGKKRWSVRTGDIPAVITFK